VAILTLIISLILMGIIYHNLIKRHTIMLRQNKIIISYSCIFIALLLILFPCQVHGSQQEVILNFSSDIVIHKDSLLTVSETITVNVLGKRIKRGIYRDFPTTYKDHSGNRVHVGFSLKKVLRNGNKEPYHIKNTANGIRIYIGDKNVSLNDGVYTYEILYETTSQLGFFTEYDELYWNVTGNDWAFPIETASVKIRLPVGATIIQSAGYTGPLGAKGKDFSIVDAPSADISFVTTKHLKPGEGLTIAIAWPKGFVTKPMLSQQILSFFSSNRDIQVCLIMVILIFTYFLAAWFKVGKDPARGVIIPRYSPPDNLSPAVPGFLEGMYYQINITSLSATILNMAVKGSLVIEEPEKNKFSLLCKNKTKAGLTIEEQAVFDKLFPSSEERLDLSSDEQNYVKEIHDAQYALLDALEKNYGKGKKYFSRNIGYGMPGCLVSLALVIGLFWYSATTVVNTTSDDWVGIVVLLIFWTVGIYSGFALSFRSWFAGNGCLSFLFLLIGIPFGSIVLFFNHVNNIGISPATLITLAIVPAMNYVFSELMKAPSQKGQRILDEFEGFKLYLSTAEKERLNILNPPEETPELFSRFLPYALALGVEQEWSERFDTILRRTKYQPSWYRGVSSFTTFTQSFSSGSGFHSTLASAGTRPGSSSTSGGSGGGGSSGGGGGGGGGGGW